MILSKKKLFNTYIENDKGELRDLYFSAIEKSGLETKVDGLYSDYNHRFISVLGDCNYVQSISDPLLVRKCKKLTLSDLKPRTKVEYVHLDRTNFNVWDLKPLLDSGELYSKTSEGEYDQYCKSSPTYMLRHFMEYGVYRKVERPVEWWEDAVEFIVESDDDDLSAYFDKQSGNLRVNTNLPRDKWCDFARILLEQEGE